MKIIGIPSWSLIKNRKELKLSDTNQNLTTYLVGKTQQTQQNNQEYHLCQYHTHFFLIDTPPSKKTRDEIFDMEITFRTGFESSLLKRFSKIQGNFTFTSNGMFSK